MAKEHVRLNTRIDQWKDLFNDLTNDVGDIALLTTGDTTGGDSDLVTAINELDSDIGARPHTNLTTATKTLTAAINEHDAELGTITSVAMGTTASTVSTAIAELDGRLDSINDTLISSPKLYISDSAANNRIHGNLEIRGNAQIDGTLTVDGVVNFKAGSNGSVTLGDANTDNVVFNADVNSNVVPNTNNAFDLGSTSQEWRHLWVTGNGNIDHLVSDSADITGSLTVGGVTTLNGNVDIGNATSDTVSITARIDTDFVPSTNNARDLGSSSLEFRHLWVTGNGNIDHLVSDSADITGSLTVGGLTSLNGNIDLGNATSDTLSVTARVDTDFVPSTNNVRSLGTASLQWKDLHVKNVSADSATIGGDLDVQGITTLDSASIDGTLSVTKLVTANAGVKVDNTTFDANALTTSGSFTIDVSGDINLDADGADIIFKDGGSEFGRATNDGTQLKLSSQNGQWMKFTAAGVRFSGIIADSDLTTTAKSVVSSINELKQTLDILDSASGANTDLLFANLGDLNNLNTAIQTSAVAAINELHDGLDSDARKAFSAATSGTGYGNLTYNNGTGVFTYAKVTDADIRGRFTGGNAITYTSASGTIAVTSNAIQADELAVTGNGTAGQALISDGDGTFSWGRKVPNIYDSDGTLLN